MRGLNDNEVEDDDDAVTRGEAAVSGGMGENGRGDMVGGMDSYRSANSSKSLGIATRTLIKRMPCGRYGEDTRLRCGIR